jgi:hypothetical protein
MRTLASVAALLLACGGNSTNPDFASTCNNFPTSGDLPCDVSTVLAGNCQHCHSDPPQHGAPFPEVTYQDLEQPFGSNGLHRWQRMAQVIVPGATPIHMPPAGQPQLSDAELNTLLDWFAQCAPPQPAGTGCPGSDGGVADMSVPLDGPNNGDGPPGVTPDLAGTKHDLAMPCLHMGDDCTMGQCCLGLTCTIPSYICY